MEGEEPWKCKNCCGVERYKDGRCKACTAKYERERHHTLNVETLGPCKKCGGLERYKGGKCKSCKAEYNHTPQQLAKSRERAAKRKSDPEGRKRIREWSAKYYSNPEIRERKNKYKRARDRTPEGVERRRKYTQENWAADLLKSARSSSKKRKHEAPTITIKWILEQPLVCPYTRMNLDPSRVGEAARNKPSLDRVDNKIGYTPENTKLTAWLWNVFRRTKTVEETLEDLTEWLWAVKEEAGWS